MRLIALALVWPGTPARSAPADPAGLDRLEATRTRPLFSPTRRPPPPLAQPIAPLPLAPAPVLAPPPALLLSGVVVGTDRTIAVVRRASDGKTISLDLGREIDGWTVTAIRARAIEMRQGTRMVVLKLAHD